MPMHSYEAYALHLMIQFFTKYLLYMHFCINLAVVDWVVQNVSIATTKSITVSSWVDTD